MRCEKYDDEDHRLRTFYGYFILESHFLKYNCKKYGKKEKEGGENGNFD